MNRFVVILLVIFCFTEIGFTQKYFTRTGQVSFSSDTPLEKIDAHNKSGNCVIDFSTGKIEFAVLNKGFQFQKALMQEHFNENYMESNKYPKSVFKGQLDNYKEVNISKNGKIKSKIIGQLTIHGVTKDIVTEANIEIVSGKISASTSFDVAVADYGISIPSLVRESIAKNVTIKVDATLASLK